MRLLSLWAPVAAWCGLIFFFSSIPDLSSGLELDYPLRKAAHAAEYAVLFLLARRAFRGHAAARPSAAAALFALAYAASDEWHQSWVPGRFGRLSDLGFDGAGVASAWAFIRWRRPGHKPTP